MLIVPKKSLGLIGILTRVLMLFLGLALFLAIIIPTFFFFFFDPNDFKPQIAQFINQATGLDLKIEGPIALNYFPNIAIQAKNINAQQPTGYGDGHIVHIEDLELKVPVRELFQKHLHVTDFTVQGLKLNLIAKAEDNNWQHLIDRSRQKNKAKASKPVEHKTTSTSTSTTIETPENKKKMTFELSQIHVQNAQLVYTDEKPNQKTVIDHIQIQIDKNNVEDYRFKLQYQLKQAAAHKHYEGKGDIQGLFSTAKTLATFSGQNDIQLQDASLPLKNLQVKFKGVASAEYLTLDTIDLQSDIMQLTGKASVPLKNKTAPITFSLAGDTLNLDKLQHNLKSTPVKSVDKKTTSTTVTTAPVATTNNGKQAIKGSVAFKSVIAKNVQLDNVKADVNVQNNKVILAPVTAQAFGGQLNMKTTTTLGNKALTYAEGTFNNINLIDLLTQLKQKARIQGQANIGFNLIINNNISGTSKVEVQNGVIDGFDLRYYIHMAEALLKKTQNQAQDTKQTPFGKLSANFNIHDDMVETNDLTLLASDLKATGEGTVYLISQSLEFKVKANRLRNNEMREHGYPLALRIHGGIARPKVTPDLDVYLKLMLKEEVQKELGKQVEKNLKKIISSEGEVNTKDVQEKIEKEISKGLKKLFKKHKDE